MKYGYIFYALKNTRRGPQVSYGLIFAENQTKAKISALHEFKETYNDVPDSYQVEIVDTMGGNIQVQNIFLVMED